MSELTWAELSLLDVAAIDDAASHWSTYIGQLSEAAEAIDTGVRTRIGEESFGEQIGEDCRSQVRAIASEIHDHIDEAAEKIKTVLLDAYEDLSTCKTDIQGLIDEVLDAKLRIREDGEVYLSDARLADLRAWAEQQPEVADGDDLEALVLQAVAQVEQAECQPLTERIRRLVETARGYDEAFTTRLNNIRDAYVQMPPPLGSDWHEDVAEYWSDRAIALLEGGEDGELSAAELDEFNEIVGERADNPVFATTLMNELGPAGLTTHLADVVWNVYDNDPGNDRFTADQVNEVYEALGLTLATATDPTNERHVDEEWIAELMNLGGSEVVTSDGHWRSTGYELLAPVLPHGQYHEDFLVPVTEHMIALDNSLDWGNGPPLSGVDAAIPGVGYGNNPVNYALAALDNNPRAALNLFDGGGTRLADIGGVDLGDAQPVADPFEYLMDRAGEYGTSSTTINPDLLGNALESATTGVPTDPAFAPDPPPVHTSRMAALADRLIDHVTNSPAEFTSGPKSEMLDNFGAVTVAYIDDFHRAMGSDGTEVWAVDQLGVDLSLGSPGPENERLAMRWLQVVGYDQGATAEVWGASEGLMYGQLENALAHDDQGIQAGEAFEMHGRVAAALTVGSLDAIADGVYQRAADQNELVDRFADGLKFGTAVTSTLVTNNPVAGLAADQLAGNGIDFLANFLRMTEAEAEAEIAALSERQMGHFQEAIRPPATLDHIRQILESNSDLSEANIQTYLDNFYDRYWDRVAHYYDARVGG